MRVSAAAHARCTLKVADVSAFWKMNTGSDALGAVERVVVDEVVAADDQQHGAVSPMTRAIASITPVVMPVEAVGSTMRSTVFHFGTPRAYDASRSALGTSRIISSEVRTTIGSSRMDKRQRAGEAGERPGPGAMIQNASTNRPATIDGMPVITSTRKRTPVASAFPPYSVM